MQCLWGAISPQLLQQIAKLAIHDLNNAAAGKLDMNHLERLASLGTHGFAHFYNIHVLFVSPDVKDLCSEMVQPV